MRLRCPGPLPRREFLQAGALALSGLTLPGVLAGRAAAGQSRSDTAVILLYLHGGPSQLETYDLKPDAPIEYRSLYSPIATAVPGMQICELLPLHAKLADKIAIVRSMHHTVGIHSDGGILVTTGKMPSKLDPTSTSKSEHPDFGMIAGKVRGPHPDAVPQYVSIPNKLYFNLPTYLGMHHAAFEAGDPANTGYTPPSVALAGANGAALGDRRRLIQQFDRLRTDLSPRLQGIDEFREQAFALLTSPKTAAAFDVSRESAPLRDRYGRHAWGQGCLLARRLADAGTAVVSLYINSPMPGPDYTNWDDHIQNAGRPGHFAMYMSRRLPFLDQALSALIEDIYARGLDRRILVVVTGEFGRTPRLSHNSFGTGRDHWPDAYSVLLSGGGLRMGQVIGGTNSKAEFPTERPYSPFDLGDGLSPPGHRSAPLLQRLRRTADPGPEHGRADPRAVGRAILPVGAQKSSPRARATSCVCHECCGEALKRERMGASPRLWRAQPAPGLRSIAHGGCARGKTGG